MTCARSVKGFTALIAFRRDFAIAVNVGIVRTAWILNNALIVKRRFASAASPKEDAAVPIKSGVITVLIIMMMC